MKLEDLITTEGLLQDEFSLSGKKFNNSEVVGWSGRQHTGKFYIIKCPVCALDLEMYQDGYFRSLKSNLIKGQIPCGCGRGHKYNESQFKVLCTRKAESVGYKFLGFQGEWKGAKTKIKLLCQKHGQWDNGIIDTLLNGERGCPSCMVDAFTLRVLYPDSVMIESFFASGGFSEGTLFWRSDRKTKQGSKSYWFMSCPDCAEIGEAASNNLQQGKRPCKCSAHRQQECYINLIVFQDNVLALKFGIANSSKRRAKKQDKSCIYDVYQYRVYVFESVNSCKKAERECKQELQCGILTKEEMPDGYTETTHPRNLDKLDEIFRRNGGSQAVVDENYKKLHKMLEELEGE